MKSVAIIFLLSLICTNGHTQDTKRLEEFLSKIEKFYMDTAETTSWSMPNYAPRAIDGMPMPKVLGVMSDPRTGLEYAPAIKKIYDRQLEFLLDMESKTVLDYKSGKKYTLSELKSKRKKRA